MPDTPAPVISSTSTTGNPVSYTVTTSSTDTAGDVGGDDTKDWKGEAEKWQSLARKHEERSKANSTAAKELEQLRQQAMSDTEKAVAQAKVEGRVEGIAAVSTRLVSAEIRAAAAGRMTAEQLEALLEVTNLAVFIGEDGEVDQAKVQRFVDGIAPMPDDTDGGTRQQAFPDLGQGARGGSNTALNGDPLLRDLKTKLGIR